LKYLYRKKGRNRKIKRKGESNSINKFVQAIRATNSINKLGQKNRSINQIETNQDGVSNNDEVSKYGGEKDGRSVFGNVERSCDATGRNVLI